MFHLPEQLNMQKEVLPAWWVLLWTSLANQENEAVLCSLCHSLASSTCLNKQGGYQKHLHNNFSLICQMKKKSQETFKMVEE